ncbi:hypothetical protein [Pedobacter heparinus]|uniref:Uncharacterized protein n=1 Tax=Pedobacter heparinus (strain ATCC 13125 / DSM 2366 / CIP 104194 / JCM 7457 / NBRC 12017 / NCIMB 9290 / NRRL B-14731 / HIM 762-3) TaxID=485917 RepID=C6XV71_PEDHD|nr:hypothetical protein [Pedobacter heparinus]ACU03937.1 conserved hypothetical protein [Pedobacter heparinus DSM 2366]
MENQDHLPEEEVINPEQFQVGRNPVEQEETNQDGSADNEQAGYTPGETEFADGEGTRLEQESEELEIDQETNDLDDLDIDPENDPDSSSSSEEEDADFENPDDDPA